MTFPLLDEAAQETKVRRLSNASVLMLPSPLFLFLLVCIWPLTIDSPADEVYEVYAPHRQPLVLECVQNGPHKVACLLFSFSCCCVLLDLDPPLSYAPLTVGCFVKLSLSLPSPFPLCLLILRSLYAPLSFTVSLTHCLVTTGDGGNQQKTAETSPQEEGRLVRRARPAAGEGECRLVPSCYSPPSPRYPSRVDTRR